MHFWPQFRIFSWKKTRFFWTTKKIRNYGQNVFFRILLGFFEVPEFVRTIFNAKLALKMSVRFFLKSNKPPTGRGVRYFQKRKKGVEKIRKKSSISVIIDIFFHLQIILHIQCGSRIENGSIISKTRLGFF